MKVSNQSVLKNIPSELFKIIDTETNEFWETYKKKCVWNKIGHAKSAWTSAHWRDNIKFDDQDKYAIVRFTTDCWQWEII